MNNVLLLTGLQMIVTHAALSQHAKVLVALTQSEENDELIAACRAAAVIVNDTYALNICHRAVAVIYRDEAELLLGCLNYAQDNARTFANADETITLRHYIKTTEAIKDRIKKGLEL